jgi:type IV pilus assembly protein PilE
MSGRERGFTLVELVVTIAILGILVTIAYPSYLRYTLRGYRTDATRTLIQDAQVLERCYSQTFTYAGCAAAPVGTATSAQARYTVTVALAPAPYTITAVPNGAPQSGDTQCASFTLSGAGVQGATDSSNNNTTAACWGSN